MVNVLQKNWQDLIKPTKLEVTPGRDREKLATVVAEPLERGFGMTLGNALRRVLLSSLQGAAIKTVQIDGVLHEFSSIPGVREDVTNIILNIKEIALRVHSEGVKRMVLKKEGGGPARAKDIEGIDYTWGGDEMSMHHCTAQDYDNSQTWGWGQVSDVAVDNPDRILVGIWGDRDAQNREREGSTNYLVAVDGSIPLLVTTEVSSFQPFSSPIF